MSGASFELVSVLLSGFPWFLRLFYVHGQVSFINFFTVLAERSVVVR